MSFAEFQSWAAFYSEEPWGDYRADLRAGIIAATVARMLGAKGARPKPLDFMPVVRSGIERAREHVAQTDRTAEIRAHLFAAFKGRVRHVRITREERAKWRAAG